MTALARARRFQAALWDLFARPLPTLDATPQETLVCRCEEVTMATLRRAMEANPGDIGAAKRATRIGMGRCQGRYCGPALATLVAERRGVAMDERAFFAPRPPIKPVPVAMIRLAESLVRAPDPEPDRESEREPT